MKILFIGDISGRPGRETVKKLLPEVRAKHKPDFVIANCENSAGGKGVTREILDELSGYGIDFFTAGEHIWDQKHFRDELYDINIPIVRAYNYEATDQIPGKAFEIIDLGKKGKLVVAIFLGQAFMRDFVKNPFWAADEFLKKLKENEIGLKDIIVIDFHAEATAEKISFAHYLKNKVTAVLGTHTHVPTADERLMGNTAYVTDVGMVGPLEASLWANFDNILHNFKFPFKKPMQMEEEGRRVFNSVLVEIENGKSTKISRIDRFV